MYSYQTYLSSNHSPATYEVGGLQKLFHRPSVSLNALLGKSYHQSCIIILRIKSNCAWKCLSHCLEQSEYIYLAISIYNMDMKVSHWKYNQILFGVFS